MYATIANDGVRVPPTPGRRHDRRRTARFTSTPAAHAGAGWSAPQTAAHGARDAGERRRRRRHRAAGRDPRLPGRRQDRHRQPRRRRPAAATAATRRRSSASRRPTTRGSSSRSCCRTPGNGHFGGAARRPGVQARHDLRAAERCDIPPTGTTAPRIRLTGDADRVASRRARSPTDRACRARPCRRAPPRRAGGAARASGRADAAATPAPASPASRSTRGRSVPGDLYAALPGARAHGADFARRRPRRGRGRGAHRRRPGATGRAGAGLAGRSSSPTRARVLGAVAALGLRRARPSACCWSGSPAPTARPRRPTCSRPALRAAGRAHRADRHGRDPDRRRAASTASRTTPEAPDLHALLARDARARRRRRARWRSPATRWRWAGSTASSSTSPASPT